MIGTSIGDLNKKDQTVYYDNIRNLQDMTQTNYGAGQNMHYEQGHNAAHQMHQAQQIPYYNMPNNQNYPQFTGQAGQPGNQYPGYLSQTQKQKQKQETIDIEELAKDINDNLTEDTFASVSESVEEQHTSGSLNLLSNIPAILREPIIILILFIILSQPTVKDTLGKYINQLNPDMEGKFSFTGIVIFGIIFAALFALTKKFIL